MSEAPGQPFQREEHLDEPGIIGARWWQRSLQNQTNAMDRRSALAGITGAVVAIGMVGAVFTTCAVAVSSSSSDDDTRTEARGALEMQREYGWNFGAVGEQLTFDGTATRPFDRAALARLADDLRPTTRHAPYFVPTLFQSPTAMPRSTPKGDTGTAAPLKDALQPLFTKAMDRAYRAGRALASLWKGQSPGAAVIVDLPGPEAVAFAAGAAGIFDPVFLFDNWPHPRGVVPAHLTLAAAAYYQPLFARRKAANGAPPMFVLDRARLNAYADDSSQFDNRHVARIPSAAQMKALGASHVLYVVPMASDTVERDDLNDDFVLYARGGVDVKIAALQIFDEDPGDITPPAQGSEDDPIPRYYYGGRMATHAWFWADYPWARVAAPRGTTEPIQPRPGKDYVPRPRTTPFSSGSPGGARPRPSGFGTVPVVIAVATGAILGAKLSRSGSWTRSSGSGWGG